MEARRALILVIGGEGAGKTTLLHALQDACAGEGTATLHYDGSTAQDPSAVFENDLAGGGGNGHSRPFVEGEGPTIVFLDAVESLGRNQLARFVACGLREREDGGRIQMVLFGRPEFGDRLQLPAYAEIASRIRLSVCIGALMRHEVGFYLRHRSRVSGRVDRRFDQAALERLHSYSDGNPGLIERIADRLDGVAAEPIGSADIDAAIATLDGEHAGGRLTVALFRPVEDSAVTAQHGTSARAGPTRRATRFVVTSATIVVAGAATAVALLYASTDPKRGSTADTERPVIGTVHPLSSDADVEARKGAQQPVGFDPAGALRDQPRSSRERAGDGGPAAASAVVPPEPRQTQAPDPVPQVPANKPDRMESHATGGVTEPPAGIASRAEPQVQAPRIELARPTASPAAGAPSPGIIPESRVEDRPVSQTIAREAPKIESAPQKPERNSEADEFLRRGIQFLEARDVASARLFLERAAALGVPEAYTAVGQTFDPLELQRLGIIGMRGQPEAALRWYRLGEEHGDPHARDRISRLAGSPR